MLGLSANNLVERTRLFRFFPPEVGQQLARTVSATQEPLLRIQLLIPVEFFISCPLAEAYCPRGQTGDAETTAAIQTCLRLQRIQP